jgi:hypothetical protein
MELPGRAGNLADQRIKLRKKPGRQRATAFLFVISQNSAQIFLDEPMKHQRHRLSA